MSAIKFTRFEGARTKKVVDFDVPVTSDFIVSQLKNFGLPNLKEPLALKGLRTIAQEYLNMKDGPDAFNRRDRDWSLEYARVTALAYHSREIIELIAAENPAALRRACHTLAEDELREVFRAPKGAFAALSMIFRREPASLKEATEYVIGAMRRLADYRAVYVATNVARLLRYSDPGMRPEVS